MTPPPLNKTSQFAELERVVRSASALALELAGPSGDSRILRRWLRAAASQLEQQVAEMVETMTTAGSAERHLVAIAHHLLARLASDDVHTGDALAVARDFEHLGELFGAVSGSVADLEARGPAVTGLQ